MFVGRIGIGKVAHEYFKWHGCRDVYTIHYHLPYEALFGCVSLAKDPVSMAASIIRFPLIIDVVDMTMFRRSDRYG